MKPHDLARRLIHLEQLAEQQQSTPLDLSSYHEDGTRRLDRSDAEQLDEQDIINEAIQAFRSRCLLWKSADCVKVGFGWDDPNCDYVIFDTERASYYWCLAERIISYCRENKAALCLIRPDEVDQVIGWLQSDLLVLHRYTERQRPYHDRPLKPWHYLVIRQAKFDYHHPSHSLADLTTKQYHIYCDQVECYVPDEAGQVPADLDGISGCSNGCEMERASVLCEPLCCASYKR